MTKKKNRSDNSIVYSTDPGYTSFEQTENEDLTLPADQQKLKIKMETKHRGGKTVTIVEGFTGKEEDLENLGKQLKNYCGSGGSVKNNEVIIQGDHRDKVLQYLQNNGYRNSRKI